MAVDLSQDYPVLMSTQQVTTATGLNARAVAALRDSGAIRSRRNGKNYLHPRDGVEDWLNGSDVEPVPAEV